MFKLLCVQCREFSKESKRCDLSSYAASSAFFLILSLVPMLLLICAIIPYTNISIDFLIDFLNDIFPKYMVELCSSIIYEFKEARIALISVSALITLWASGKGVFALMKGLNIINDVKEQRNVILLRLTACVYVLAILLIMCLSLILLVFGNKLTDAILFRVPGLKFIYAFILHFRFIFFWAGYFIIFSILYTVLPNKKIKLKSQVPGAFVASICWSLFSWGFSLYIELFNGFSMYGSLTTIIVTMFWLYFCMYIVLIGALINLRINDFKTLMQEHKQHKLDRKKNKEQKTKNQNK